jgi:hypothetical protein
VKNEIRVIADKGKGNKTLCLRGDVLTYSGNVLIHFLELCYQRECSSVFSVGIDDTYNCHLIESVSFFQIQSAVSTTMLSTKALGCICYFPPVLPYVPSCLNITIWPSL